MCGSYLWNQINKIIINLWLGAVEWKLFITKSRANPIRSFAEFLFGKIKFCKSWGQILQISARHPPQHHSEQINQIRPHVERAAAAVFAILPSSTFYPTPIALPILAVSSISVGRMASVPHLMNLADILANPAIIKTVMMNPQQQFQGPSTRLHDILQSGFIRCHLAKQLKRNPQLCWIGWKH